MSEAFTQLPENINSEQSIQTVDRYSPSAEQLEVFEDTYARVVEEFPELAGDIAQSLETPHIGPYHREGDMIQHLQLMTQTLENIQTGDFLESLPNEYRDKFSLYAQTNTRLLEQFIFLHDLEKPNCMQLKLATEPKSVRVDISWEDWQEIEAGGEPYTFQDPSSGQVAEIESIAFFHQSDKKSGREAIKHGQAAADKLIAVEATDESLIPLIANHELAFNFQDRINTSAFVKSIVNNPGLLENIDELLLVNYLDLASSWREDGKPNIDSLLNMIASRNNYALILEVMRELESAGEVVQENDLNRLYKIPSELSADSIRQELSKAAI